ncbi:MAG: hypothetical protein NT154_34285, partial [Verrucomicrobia bacterium]|nr:hypothetical protein [Verrucomicrobiota bacterium]
THGTPNRAALVAAPGLTAPQAVALAAQNIGETLSAGAVVAAADAEPGPKERQKFKSPGLKGETEVKLIWLPLDKETLRLCWDVVLVSRKRGEMFRVLVDARSGEVFLRRCLT